MAIPAIESAAELGAPIALLATKLLREFDHPESAKSLMRIAVFFPDAQVTEAAIEALRKKQFHDFVPEMLAAMSSKISGMTVPVFDATGNLTGFRQSFTKEGVQDYRTVTLDTQLTTKHSAACRLSKQSCPGSWRCPATFTPANLLTSP